MRGRMMALGAVLVTMAAGGLLFWTGVRLYEQIEGFARTTVPGDVTVRVDQPGTQVVYLEPGTAAGAVNVAVDVTAPSGAAVAVVPAGLDIHYHLLGYDGRSVASFHAAQAGLYRLSARGGAFAAFGTLAVGGSLTGAIVAVALSCIAFVGLVVIELLVLASLALQRHGGRNARRWEPQARAAA